MAPKSFKRQLGKAFASHILGWMIAMTLYETTLYVPPWKKQLVNYKIMAKHFLTSREVCFCVTQGCKEIDWKLPSSSVRDYSEIMIKGPFPLNQLFQRKLLHIGLSHLEKDTVKLKSVQKKALTMRLEYLAYEERLQCMETSTLGEKKVQKREMIDSQILPIISVLM